MFPWREMFYTTIPITIIYEKKKTKSVADLIAECSVFRFPGQIINQFNDRCFSLITGQRYEFLHQSRRIEIIHNEDWINRTGQSVLDPKGDTWRRFCLRPAEKMVASIQYLIQMLMRKEKECRYLSYVNICECNFMAKVFASELFLSLFPVSLFRKTFSRTKFSLISPR